MLSKLLVIVGPTSSGKSAVAIEAARRYDGEVVSADSRQIYRGMDIGTGKVARDPGSEEAYFAEGIRHHLLDIAEPDEVLTLAEYKKEALAAIDDIVARGKLPILAGGTGLYISAVVDNLTIPEVSPDARRRARLEKLSDEALFDRLREEDPHYARRIGANRRYAIRALEVMEVTGKTFTSQQGKGEPLYDMLLVGLTPPQSVLENRMRRRVDEMMSEGLLEETERLIETYASNFPALSSIGYKELSAYVRGEMKLREAVEMIKLHTRQYAKRQMTWFKRDKRIVWFTSDKPVYAGIDNWLK